MKEVVLGLLGLGNIGGGVWDLIREFGDETAKRTGVKLRVKKALVLDKRIHGGKEVPDEVLTTDRDILGEAIIDFKHIVAPSAEYLATHGATAPIPTTSLIVGFIAAFVSGCFACKWMISLVKKCKLIYFAIYCAVVGLTVLIYNLI